LEELESKAEERRLATSALVSITVPDDTDVIIGAKNIQTSMADTSGLAKILSNLTGVNVTATTAVTFKVTVTTKIASDAVLSVSNISSAIVSNLGGGNIATVLTILFDSGDTTTSPEPSPAPSPMATLSTTFPQDSLQEDSYSDSTNLHIVLGTLLSGVLLAILYVVYSSLHRLFGWQKGKHSADELKFFGAVPEQQTQGPSSTSSKTAGQNQEVQLEAKPVPPAWSTLNCPDCPPSEPPVLKVETGSEAMQMSPLPQSEHHALELKSSNPHLIPTTTGEPRVLELDTSSETEKQYNMEVVLHIESNPVSKADDANMDVMLPLDSIVQSFPLPPLEAHPMEFEQALIEEPAEEPHVLDLEAGTETDEVHHREVGLPEQSSLVFEPRTGEEQDSNMDAVLLIEPNLLSEACSDTEEPPNMETIETMPSEQARHVSEALADKDCELAHDQRSVDLPVPETEAVGEVLTEKKFEITVVRGPDWEYGDQDGGVGKEGITKDLFSPDGWIFVQWEHGFGKHYRVGWADKYDLRTVNDARRQTEDVADKMDSLQPLGIVSEAQRQPEDAADRMHSQQALGIVSEVVTSGDMLPEDSAIACARNSLLELHVVDLH
jgi:hypothetical protein